MPLQRIIQVTGHKSLPTHMGYNVAVEKDQELIPEKYEGALAEKKGSWPSPGTNWDDDPLPGPDADCPGILVAKPHKMDSSQPMTFKGSHGPYRWFVTRQDDLATLLELCPQFLEGRYVAVTSFDSGPLILTEEQKASGWLSRNEIAYSPQVNLLEDSRLKGVSVGQCAGYDEWYVFDSPHDLGALCDGNVFESDLSAGKIWTFVNYDAGFALHNPEMSDLTSLFWKQLDWIQPESFVADSSAFLTFVSRNESIFVVACNALKVPGGKS